MKSRVSMVMKVRAVVCPMLINLSIGSYYAFSNINPYVANYMKVEPEDTIIVMQIWLLFQSLFAIVGVKLSDKLGYWLVNYIAFAGYAVVNLLASYIRDYRLFILVYGCLSGAFIGLGYLPALYTAWTYFPEKKSAVTGVILFCAGMSASFLSPLSTYIVNPKNLKKDDPSYGDNVPLLFRFYAIYFGLIAFIACTFQPMPVNTAMFTETKSLKRLIMSKSDKDEKQLAKQQLRRMTSAAIGDDILLEEDIQMVHRHELADQVGNFGGEEHALLNANLDNDRITDLIVLNMKYYRLVEGEADTPAATIKDTPTEEGGRKLSKMIEHNAEALYKKSKQLQELNCPSEKYGIHSSSFFMVASMAVCCSIYPYFLNSNWKSLYLDKLTDITDSKLSFILTFGAIANSGIRLIVGFLLLKVDVKSIYYFIVTISIIAAFTIEDMLKSYETGIIYIMCAYVGLGTQVTLFPTICTKVFGSTVGPKVYPIIYLCFSLSNFAQYFAYKFLGKSHMETMFYAFGTMAFIGVILGIVFNSKPSWTNAIYHYNLEQEKKVQDTQTIYNMEDKRVSLLDK